ncbi:MAG: hypothetical protein FGM54_05970 [Chitinophagaceae bacterium]|nr:hypothetical protein [Chitinophagaceae bacterium]
MENKNELDLLLTEMEDQLVAHEEALVMWLKRAVQAQNLDEAIRIKEVQWDVQRLIDRINPARRRSMKRKALLNTIFKEHSMNQKES